MRLSVSRRLLHGGVDRNWPLSALGFLPVGRLLHGGVDRNLLFSSAVIGPCWSPPSRGRGSKPKRLARRSHGQGRLLHGGVDRNLSVDLGPLPEHRRLLHGGVDRNSPTAWAIVHAWTSPPSRGRGSKHEVGTAEPVLLEGRLLHGGVDRNKKQAHGWPPL